MLQTWDNNLAKLCRHECQQAHPICISCAKGHPRIAVFGKFQMSYCSYMCKGQKSLVVNGGFHNQQSYDKDVFCKSKRAIVSVAQHVLQSKPVCHRVYKVTLLAPFKDQLG